jgi:hypothetical protein
MSDDGTGRPDNTEPQPLGANLSDDQIATLADDFTNTDFTAKDIARIRATRRASIP